MAERFYRALATAGGNCTLQVYFRTAGDANAIREAVSSGRSTVAIFTNSSTMRRMGQVFPSGLRRYVATTTSVLDPSAPEVNTRRSESANNHGPSTRLLGD